ncbi:MAG: fucose isomerase [Armatimonadota bacterium]|nr:fucose isomerase [Armatimonadota bacterium]
MTGNTIKVGVISFTDPRATSFVDRREQYIREKHKEVVQALESAGISTVDPMKSLRSPNSPIFGVSTSEDVRHCIRELKAAEADAVILGCWHWTEPMLALATVRELNLPTLLYTEDDPTWAGAVCISAVGASLWESPVNSHALTHSRLRGDLPGVIRWARGVGATEQLKRKSLLLWGGTYCLRMEHLQDDIPRLKSLMIGDILSEDQYILIKRADAILKNQPERIDSFINWLRQGSASITYDDTMLTPESFRRQVALYLASRDRLSEFPSEEIAGVSIKCQPELSVDYGVTACLLPSFLPFSADSEGERPSIPTVCEGDIKGLLSCALLRAIQPEVPPLFGDLKYIAKDYVLISNCGGSSVYYAANSLDSAKVLPKVRFAAQCQGESGGAVGYDGQPCTMTICRLCRIDGEYYMQMGVGRSLEITPEITKNILWGKTWPHIAVDLGVNPASLVAVVGANHLSATTGDFSIEITYACRELGIPIIRLDSDDDLRSAWHYIASG